jgi:hypothetical protein
MRDALNAALDATAEDDETQNYDETAQEVMLDDIPEEDTSAETVETETETPDSEAEVSVAPTEGEDTVHTDEEAKSALSGDSIKAPVNWGPKERESWSKVPRDLQEKIMSREQEISTGLQNSADARRTHEDFGKLTQQYGAVLSGLGDTPMETVNNLFSTVANLRMGSPIQKAQVIADLITDFGVDINTLDSAIVGAAPSQETQQSSQIEQIIAQRMAPFEAHMGQQNALVQQQASQRQDNANSEVHNFSQNAEFLHDVKHDMADMIDMAAKRGIDMTLEDAYAKACAINPQISAVMAERSQRATLTGASNTMASKRNAASSVTGRQIGGGGGNGAMSTRDTLNAAWDNQGKI